MKKYIHVIVQFVPEKKDGFTITQAHFVATSEGHLSREVRESMAIYHLQEKIRTLELKGEFALIHTGRIDRVGYTPEMLAEAVRSDWDAAIDYHETLQLKRAQEIVEEELKASQATWNMQGQNVYVICQTDRYVVESVEHWNHFHHKHESIYAKRTFMRSEKGLVNWKAMREYVEQIAEYKAGKALETRLKASKLAEGAARLLQLNLDSNHRAQVKECGSIVISFTLPKDETQAQAIVQFLRDAKIL